MRTVAAVLLATLMALAPAASALPTPGFNGEEAQEATGRVFPEAMQTNDFVRFDEGVDGLKLLVEQNPDLLTWHEIGSSYGWDNARTGEHDELPVFAVTMTNKNSTVPEDEKVNVLFMLSIHANEKGGREGGFRVIEDFVKAANGDGDTGVASDERVDMLDEQRLIFLFPNPDGWAHEMNEYRTDAGGDSEVTPLNYMRGNGNGTDLNRQAPTTGWSRGDENAADHAALKEPESRAWIDWVKSEFDEIHLASDIHGMLHPADSGILFDSSSEEIVCLGGNQTPLPDGPGQVCLREGHFVLTMLPAAQMTPDEMAVTTSLAEEIKQRLNGNEAFPEWNNAPEAGVWGGEYNDWGTVWDTIGYVDSGFSSDFFAQEDGLDAPGVDFELAYNHITFDNYYPGLAQRMNDYHVETVRTIVGSFMDTADGVYDVGIDTKDTDTAYVPTDYVATSEDDGDLEGWAAENPADDRFDWAHGGSYEATPNAWFEDRAPYLQGEGELVELTPEAIGQLDRFDNLVIPGSAVDRLANDTAAIDAVRAFVEDGGNLVLTDEALTLLADLGVVEADAVEEDVAYAGHANVVDDEHPLTEGLRGLARQTYEPMPLGFATPDEAGGDASPVWVVDRSSFEDAGGETVGVLDEGQTNVGQVDVGDGTVTAIGALLPNPTEEYYHPYGLADYATTYTGNQLMRNALGWELTADAGDRPDGDTTAVTGNVSGEDAEPASADADGDDATAVPGAGALGALAALAAALVAVRRRPER
jgi:hypothetical protein